MHKDNHLKILLKSRKMKKLQQDVTQIQQVGTSSQDVANTNTLQVLQYRVIGSAIIDHFDLGKNSHRQDRGSCRKENVLFAKMEDSHFMLFFVMLSFIYPVHGSTHLVLCKFQIFTKEKLKYFIVLYSTKLTFNCHTYVYKLGFHAKCLHRCT